MSKVSINFPFAGDNIVNASELSGPVSISGQANGLNFKHRYSVQIVVTDSSGVVVTFWSHNLAPNQSGVINWSSVQSLSGLRDGSYTVNASLYDDAQPSTRLDTTNYSSPNFRVDTVATLSINPVDGDWAINKAEAQGSVTIAGSTQGVEAGQNVKVNLVDQAGHIITTVDAKVALNGSWSTSLSNSIASGLKDGTYQVQASVSDVAGNHATGSHALVVDKTPPTLTVGTIAGDGILNANESHAPLVIQGSALGADGQQVTVGLNGHSYTGLVSGGMWSVSVQPSDLAALTNGNTYTVTANVADAAGNKATQASKALIIHDVAPTLAIATIAGDNVVSGAESHNALTINGTAAGANGLQVSVGLNGHTYTATVANGAWAVNVQPSDLGALQNSQSYQVTASVTDAYGNAAQASKALAIVTSTAAPVVALANDSGTSSIDKLTNDGRLSVNGTAAGATLSYSLNGGTTFTSTAPTAASYGADGQKTVLVKSTDAYSNSATTSLTFNLDTNADVGSDLKVTSASPTVGSAGKSAVGFSVAGLDTDASAVVTFTDSASHAVKANVTGIGSGTADLSSFVDGNVSIAIAASDTAGNTATGQGSSLSLLTSTAAPVVALANDTGTSSIDKFTNDGTLSVNGTAAGATLSYSLNGGTTFSATAPTTASYGADGQKTVLVKSTDAYSNSATTSFTFNLDTNADVGSDLKVTSASPTVGSAGKSAVGFTVAGLDTDASAIVTFTDSANHQVTANVAGIGSGTADLSSFVDGNVSIAIAATDTAGNTATGQGDALTLATTPNNLPTVPAIVASVAEDAAYTTNLLASAFDPDADTVVLASAAGSTTSSGGRTLVSGTDYSVNLQTGSFALTAAGIAQFNSLKQGASDAFVLDFQATDGHSNVPSTLTLTVNGGNDGPSISVGSGDLASASITNITSALVLTKNGTLTYSDADTGDTHTVSVAPQSGDLGSLSASAVPDASGSGSGGKIVWNYQVDEAKLSNLGAGQTVTDSFNVTLNDGPGAQAQQTVSVMITGTGAAAQTVPLTTTTDIVTLGSADTAVVGNALTLNDTDQLTGGSGYDTLALYDAGTFDLRAPLTFTGFKEVDLIDNTAGGQTTTLYVPDAQDLLVATRGNNSVVITTGTGNDTINAAGGGTAEIHLGSGNDTVNSDKTGGSAIYFGSGLDQAIVNSNGSNSFFFSDGNATVTATISGGGRSTFNKFTLGSGDATITATANGSARNIFILDSGDATITATAQSNNGFALGSGSANITATSTSSSNNFTLGNGTFSIDSTAAFASSFSASDPSQLHSGDVIKIMGGSGSLNLGGAAGAEYSLADVSLTNVTSLNFGSGIILDANTASLTGFTSISGSGELRTADATLDLSGKTVAVGMTIDSTNATGTTFTVTDAQTALDVIGGSGQDTLVASGITLTAAQKSDIFQGSVEVVIDDSGTYAAQATIHLTSGADPITLGSADTTVIGNALTLNDTDQLTGGSGYDTLALYDAGTFDLRAPLTFTGFKEVDLIDNTAGGQTTTLYVPDAQDLLVATRGNNSVVITTGTGNDTINAAGGGTAEIHLGSGNDTVNSDKTGGSAIYFGSGLDQAIVNSNGSNSFFFSDGNATVTATTIGNFSTFNKFTLGSGDATITATANGSARNIFILDSGDATITATAQSNNGFALGSGSANITATSTSSSNNFTLGNGTFSIDSTAAFASSFSASDPSQLHSGDVIKIMGGSGSLNLGGAAGAEYSLADVSLTNVTSLNFGSGIILDANTASLTGFTSISGSGELRTADATLDLSGKTVAVGMTIDSTNATGTTFTVTDAQTALDVIGGSGQDTLVASGITLTAAQKFDIFNQGSVEVITDASGQYASNANGITLTASNTGQTLIAGSGAQTLVSGTGDDTLVGGAGTDTFVFHANFGNDTLTGYHSGDAIQIDQSVFQDFATLQAASQDVANADGTHDTTVTTGTDTITVKQLQASLTASDFHFV